MTERARHLVGPELLPLLDALPAFDLSLEALEPVRQGLAAALALRLRDRGSSRLAGQVLNYPMLDHGTGAPEGADNPSAGEFS